MRTIKFRAWHKARKEMYNVHGWHSEFVFKDTMDGIGTEGNPDRIEEVEIMQFTGLHDKNRREIYEGDVVRVDCSPVIGSFEDGVYVVAYILPDCAYCLESVDKKSAIQFNECYVYEVIGNIHENPELLNQ